MPYRMQTVPRRALRAALLLAAMGLVGSSGAEAAVVGEAVPPGAAQESSRSSPRIAGEYRYVGGETERQALLAAIESVVAEMNFLARPIARRRLRESNLPSAELRVVVTTDAITLVRPGRPLVTAPRDGSTIVWEGPGGDEFRVQHRLVGDDRLVQEFVGDGNRSENVFSLDPTGVKLTVQTTITADRLPSALRFRTTYLRKPQAE